MDNVQKYLLLLIIFDVTLVLYQYAKSHNFNLTINIINLLISLPIIGRVFGWW